MARGKILNNIKYCSQCGSKILLRGYDTKQRLARLMKSQNLCFDCAYWQNLADYPLKNMEIINNKCYQIFPEVADKDKTMLLGGRGKRKYFMRKDLTPFKSNDIWLIGVIPQRFRHLFPPTACEINLQLYRIILNNRRICQAVGCMDRYHCVRYNLELEKDKKPFNTVPKNWKIGDEHCKFFLNKKHIISDQSSVNLNQNPNGTNNEEAR